MRIAPFFLALFVAQFAQASSLLTFNREIGPIIYRNCSSCHRPGEAAPFALLSYADVAKRGKLIAKVASSRFMPPWKAEPASYPYRDERYLSQYQIDAIQAWVKQGMPEGDGEKPQPPKFTSGWQLGSPDLVIEMPEGYHVPADGPDIYRNIAVPMGITEDKWISSSEILMCCPRLWTRSGLGRTHIISASN